jgi:hypothetical protein
LDYLLWWRKGMDLPVLVSTGTLDDPTTRILFGGRGVGDEVRPGGRVTLGYWLDNCAGWAVGGRFFALGEQNARFDSLATGEPTIARPFFDLVQMRENALVVNGPPGLNQVDGNVLAGTSSDVLGADVYLQKLLYEDCRSRLDFIAGYQATRIDEELNIRHTFRGGGLNVEGEDRFNTQNEFHGGQLGLLFEYHRSCFSLDMLAKVGLGNTEQRVTINGSTVVTNVTGPPQTTVTDGGLLAQPTNSGSFIRDKFTVVPEIGVNLAYHLSQCIDVSLGYSFIYWSEVLRPADQIDRVINDTQIGGGTLIGQPRPRFLFQGTDFWVQGVNLGVTWHF